MPVTPVLTFVGSGVISVYGLPKDCLVATHRELDRLLIAGGSRISTATAEKLSRVARHPSTWVDSTAANGYRWYAEGITAGDKRSHPPLGPPATPRRRADPRRDRYKTVQPANWGVVPGVVSG